jgi:chromosome segregation ATPase
MEEQTELRKAMDKAKALRAEQDALRRKLNAAITAADPNAIMETEKRMVDIQTEIFASDLNLLKAKLEDADARRVAAVSERDRLEATDLKRAAETYALSVEVCDRARREYQAIQAVLFSKDSAVENARTEFNSFRDELKKLVEERVGGNN